MSDIDRAPPAPLSQAARIRLTRGGPLARNAAIACGSIPFRSFLYKIHGLPAFTSDAAAEAVRQICGTPGCPLASRAYLDHDPAAAARWRDLWKAYEAWARSWPPPNGR